MFSCIVLFDRNFLIGSHSMLFRYHAVPENRFDEGTVWANKMWHNEALYIDETLRLNGPLIDLTRRNFEVSTIVLTNLTIFATQCHISHSHFRPMSIRLLYHLGKEFRKITYSIIHFPRSILSRHTLVDDFIFASFK